MQEKLDSHCGDRARQLLEEHEDLARAVEEMAKSRTPFAEHRVHSALAAAGVGPRDRRQLIPGLLKQAKARRIRDRVGGA